MIGDHLFVWAAFLLAGSVFVVSLYVAFMWLPRKMERAYQNALRTLATAVETKDSRTLGHAEHVAELVARTCEKLSLSREQIKLARWAALMRDIGKAAVPHRILNKDDELTEGELRVVRSHVKEGSEIVAQIPKLKPIQNIILHHHERWDGTGYPDGLKGEQIPFLARIIGIVDDYEAMTSDRPYHPAMSDQDVIQFITKHSGTLYDPVVAEAFLLVLLEKNRATRESEGKEAA